MGLLIARRGILASGLVGEGDEPPPPDGVVAGTTTHYSSASSHDVPLPNETESGDVLIMFVRRWGGGTGLAAVTGWTTLRTQSSNGQSRLYVRVADGNEGATVTVGTGGLGLSAVVHAVRGAEGSVEANSVAFSANPPSLSPSWGSDNALWVAGLALRMTDDIDPSITGTPDDYDDLTFVTGTTATNTAHVATARRVLETATQNPSTWSYTANDSTPHAWTIAVRLA